MTSGVEADRHGFHLVQRPLEWRVVLARGYQDGELQQRAPDRGFPTRVHARAGAPESHLPRPTVHRPDPAPQWQAGCGTPR